ncbi:MAG TPA: hypothetical protein VJ698_17415 [Noviherbaspirillum sp.]|uniref:hypothetical protein n=1 Tax=Noviherbaspirillum sp. TaxID=1926288 RepID=UPI002B4882D5|nr:hypothetical protein [Noviherbaspirillum sp.]HJV87249.1 hypothetical protein [Noviherbaspirillum sp.]
MANREELLIIRAARAGQAAAQLKLGKRYLFGGSGLPKSLATALYWLDRAAQQDEQDAWLLIGRHVPYETVRQATHPSKLYVWYERAFDAGVAQAGLVLAKLVLGQVDGAVSEAMREKAMRALHAAAQAGIAEAQWLLAQSIGHGDGVAMDQARPEDDTHRAADDKAMREWAVRAANSGVVDAQYALAEHAWASGNRDEFLRWAHPLAERVVDRADAATLASRNDISIVTRCAQALFDSGAFRADIPRFLEFASQAGDSGAQRSLGLWMARMDVSGKRMDAIPGPANYKKAIRWLQAAGQQGEADAWFALSRIFLKPECSQRNLTDARRYLERAAQAGCGAAQMELGLQLWRHRREDGLNDVQALAWLQKAQSQGIAEAQPLIDRIATRPEPEPWAQTLLGSLTREMSDLYPQLAARIELAALFGLSRTEALLIDPKTADHGHCLVVDIRAQHPHSKRRLIQVRNAGDRRALDRLVAIFEHVASGPDGPEGNYRQRLYRLKMLEHR